MTDTNCPACDGLIPAAELPLHIASEHQSEADQAKLRDWLKTLGVTPPEAPKEPAPEAPKSYPAGGGWEVKGGRRAYRGEQCYVCGKDLSRLKKPGRHVSACEKAHKINQDKAPKAKPKKPAAPRPKKEKAPQASASGWSVGRVVETMLPRALYSDSECELIASTWDSCTDIKLERYTATAPPWVSLAVAAGVTAVVSAKVAWRKVRHTPEVEGLSALLKGVSK